MISQDGIEAFMPEVITAEMFKAATGREPVWDDLERCNCKDAGKIGHWCCGWNAEHNKPQFEIGPIMTGFKL